MVLTQPGHLEKGFRGKCHPREQSLKASVGVSRRVKGALGEPPVGQKGWSRGHVCEDGGSGAGREAASPTSRELFFTWKARRSLGKFQQV